MSSSSGSGRTRHSHDRPVLPPIRDLFRELSSSGAPPESPALTLARLRVSDDEDRSYGPSSSHGHAPRPSSTRPPSRSYPDPSTFVYPQPSRYNTAPAAARTSSSHDRHAPTGPYPMLGFQNPPPRSMSHDEAAYPPHPHRSTISHDPRYDSRGPRPPFDYNPMMGQPQPIPPYYTRAQPPSLMPPVISTSVHGSHGEDDDRTPVARYQSSGLVGFAPPDASSSAGGPSKYECSYCGKGFSRPSSLRIHLNSHTGEKPFVCPVDGCGRSFSVLSNMRRHARVHVTPSMPVGDSGSERTSPVANSSHGSYRQHQRRDSSASASSSSSRRSRSVSSEEEEDYDRPEKRTRHHRK
ncbi:hypothetical protein DFH07DRAFT_953069 [Mycena maculata]|uniref:C2H2-type domain-containing protein n=1 Tax=Mycena maculata TaxID=230809 RepID=A0AAD7JXL4_9AGAR|nr:hypothetical protein DFH07DRAFT_953069 [Mycena maculata]